MCIIITVENGNFPTLKILKNAEYLNNDGGSIAWLEQEKKNYKKGINANQIYKIIKKLKKKNVKDAIIHFRIASVGIVKPALCHPFPISKKVDLSLENKNMKSDLLFHNGTITDWQDRLIEILQKNDNLRMLKGDLSDSRIIAWILYQKGYKYLNEITTFNKFAILTKSGVKKYGNWHEFKNNSYSNKYLDVFETEKLESNINEYDKYVTNYDLFSFSEYDLSDYELDLLDDLVQNYKFSVEEIKTNLDMNYTATEIYNLYTCL